MDNSWISVKERLPDTNYEWVLISFVDENNSKLRFVPSVAELRGGVWHTKESDSVLMFDFEKNCHVKVTHWMPLPRGPIYE